ncbi:MAG: amino acid adenylation domain-containing protein, partial [Acidobacteriota bacterium]
MPIRTTPLQSPQSGAETVWDLIQARGRAEPEKAAVFDGFEEISYRRLLARADGVAAELAARGVGPRSLVGVCMGRSWELIATLLGILRAGGAYVPLDPAYPQERIRYMLEHSRAAVAVVDGEANARRCERVAELVRLDRLGSGAAAVISPHAPGLSASRPSASDLAYVLYTSGSTGRPKGVAVEHRSVVAMTRAMRSMLRDEELDGVLAAASICFDASVLEILGTLSLGGTLVLAQNMLDLPELPSADRVRTCVTVPSAMAGALAAGPLPKGMLCVALGGEVLKRSLVDRIRGSGSGPRVLNVYGPTEATVYCSATEVPDGAETITIGRPVPGSRCYVLDGSRAPVPRGEVGELHLAGDQLARGYLHDDRQTRERFLDQDPTAEVPETRLYRTGDLCRVGADGELEFLGRVDQQVKIRGHRIELEEIESAMEAMGGVAAAAASVWEGDGDQALLVGYVVADGQGVTAEAVRASLAERLPRYMVPQAVVHLDALPRLPNGKLDRGGLPAPEDGRGAA